MSITSAGILMYHNNNGMTKVLLGHPGGPFYRYKDDGVWTIPKGLPSNGEELCETAVREFEEETGLKLHGSLLPIGSTMNGGKMIRAWAIENDELYDLNFKSKMFEIEWPPNSGLRRQFPELDKFEFFPVMVAEKKIHPDQAIFIERLMKRIHNYEKIY